MAKKIGDLKNELEKLIAKGEILYYAMANDLEKLGKKSLAALKAKGIQLPVFKDEYDSWYTISLRVVEQLLTDRLDDFILQYKNPKRKQVDYITYTISDYLIGLRTSRGSETIVDSTAAFPRFEKQLSILKSASAVFESSIVDIKNVLQADLFDTELEAAAELNKNGFFRGAGAIVGVVMEKHLGHICDIHNIKCSKKNPVINDFNQLLKDGDIIDTPKWRFIQHLADLRNLCDHQKDREPNMDDISELIEGVNKVIKTVF